MNVENFLKETTALFTKAKVETPRLDCLVLLEDCLNKNRTQLLAHPELEITDKDLSLLNEKIARRAKHEPLAYIRGKAEFYGREFFVNEHTLVPRPETEALIDLIKAVQPTNEPVHIADVGCGSGCIGVTLALELPNSKVTLSDIDMSALEATKVNAMQLGAHISIHNSNLLEAIDEQVNIIAANLPYVPEKYAVNKPVRFEPHHAVFSGDDGMDLYRTFWQQAAQLSPQPPLIFTESLPEQHPLMKELAGAAGYSLMRTKDFIQQFSKR